MGAYFSRSRIFTVNWRDLNMHVGGYWKQATLHGLQRSRQIVERIPAGLMGQVKDRQRRRLRAGRLHVGDFLWWLERQKQ
jgi:hypothetical protein